MTVQAYNPKAPNNPVPTSNPQTSTELLQISEPNQAHAKPSDGSCGCGGTHNHSHDHNHHHHTHAHSHSHEPEFFDDGIRVMPTSDELKRLSSDAELIQRAISEENANHSNLIASSRQSVPTITVNGVLISEQAIGEEVQYHPADSQDEALFLSAQALVIRELLRQAVMADDELKDEWQADDENAISKLIAKNVRPNTPTDSICEQYYTANQGEFTAPPVMKVRHILFACPPEEGEERIELKKRAYELIDTIKNSPNPSGEFITQAMQHSACPSKTDGGELGILQKGATVPEFEKAVFALPKGLAPSPIESRYGVHIVDVMERMDGKALSFDEALPMIRNRLSQQAFHHALIDYLYTLKQNADIVGIDISVNQENIYRG